MKKVGILQSLIETFDFFYYKAKSEKGDTGRQGVMSLNMLLLRPFRQLPMLVLGLSNWWVAILVTKVLYLQHKIKKSE